MATGPITTHIPRRAHALPGPRVQFRELLSARQAPPCNRSGVEELARPFAATRLADLADDEEDTGKNARRPEESSFEVLEPSARHVASLAPPLLLAPISTPEEATAVARARMSLEELMPALVKRIAWGGDRHRGSVRLEIGAGVYAGATLIVHAERGRVSIDVAAGTNIDVEHLGRRLGERLKRQGIELESIR